MARLLALAPTIGLVAVLLLGAPASAPAQQRAGVSIEVEGTIDPATARWLEGALRDAAQRDAALAVVRLDTPGGLVSSTRDMVQAITGAPLPVIVYVAPEGARAASAGVFVTLAGDVAAMAPQTNIGAATPVQLGGGPAGGSDEVLGRKIRNDAVAYARALAEARGRNADLAERMVRDAVSVTASRAAEAGLIELVAASQSELLRRLDGVRTPGARSVVLDTDGLSLERRDMPVTVQIQQFLVNPTVAYLLVVGGLLLVAFEVLSPGLVGPGVFGAIALVLGIYGTAQLPVTLVGIALLVGALALLVGETQTGSGLLGAGGVLALVLGGLLLFDTDSEALAVSVPIAVGAGLGLGGLVLLAARRAVQARGAPVRGAREDLIGAPATVRSSLDPVGQVHARGALWRARPAEGAASPAVGARVVVEAVEGLTLRVREQPTQEEP